MSKNAKFSPDNCLAVSSGKFKHSDDGGEYDHQHGDSVVLPCFGRLEPGTYFLKGSHRPRASGKGKGPKSSSRKTYFQGPNGCKRSILAVIGYQNHVKRCRFS